MDNTYFLDNYIIFFVPWNFFILLESRNTNIDPTFSIEDSIEVVATTVLDEVSSKSGKFG